LAIKDQDVFVVGGGNSAGQAALYLANFARSVTILVRGKGLAESMSRYLIERIETTPNLSLRTRAAIQELHGAESLEAVSIVDAESGDVSRVPARAVFVFIGAAPRTQGLSGVLQLDAQGYVLAGPDLPRDEHGRLHGWTLGRDPYWLETSVPGIFAAGDVRHASVKRVASAVGEGAMAVTFVHKYLGSLALTALPAR
ncbi:MAG: NAD(P)/FAD-dependent oxidoreductase, partial [Devosia sp.]